MFSTLNNSRRVPPTLSWSGVAVLLLATAAAAEVPQALVDELNPVVEEAAAAPQPLARGWALRTRALQGGREVQTALLAERENTEEIVRVFAGLGLIELGHREGPAALAAVLGSAGGTSQRRILDRWVRHLPEEVQVDVLSEVLDGTSDADGVETLAGWIAREGEGPVLMLLARAASAPEPVRVVIGDALVESGRPEVSDVASELAGSGDAAVRLMAARVAAAAGEAGRSVLEALLGDADPQVAGTAALALAPLGVAAAYERLLGVARDGDEALRIQALQAIRDGQPALLDFDTLHGMLEASEDPAWQRVVYEALGASRSEQAFSLLSGMVAGDLYEERALAIAGLGYSGREEAVPLLANVLLTSQRPELRAAAAQALGQLELASAAESLLDALDRERGGETKVAVIEALGHTPADQVVWSLAFQLTHAEPEVVVAALRALREQGGPAVAPQVESLVTSARTDTVRWEAALTLFALDPEVGEIRLMQSLDSAPEGFMGDIDALPEAVRVAAYLRLARHSDPDVRALAAGRIARLRDGGLPQWRVLADPSTPSDVRQMAVGVLTAHREAEDLPLFVELSESSNQSMRIDALEAVIELADPGSEALLRQLLQATDLERRVMATYGLWKLGASQGL